LTCSTVRIPIYKYRLTYNMMTASRTQFAKLAVLTVVVGFTVGSILSPPDPFSQLRITGVLVGIGFIGSYWLNYKSTVDLPTLRWDDLFRWYVSTLLFTFLIVLLVDPDNVFDGLGFDGLASRLLQLAVFLTSAGLAWIVVYSERVRWPGDR